MKFGHSTTKISYSFIKDWMVVHVMAPFPYSQMEIMIYYYLEICGKLQKSTSRSDVHWQWL